LFVKAEPETKPNPGIGPFIRDLAKNLLNSMAMANGYGYDGLIGRNTYVMFRCQCIIYTVYVYGCRTRRTGIANSTITGTWLLKLEIGMYVFSLFLKKKCWWSGEQLSRNIK
jgi:hypothetical protein